MYTVKDPPCRPVVAVAGLLCSSHTAELARIAGHDGLGGSVPLQLSAANSPIFRTHNDRFPHLWHFLGSATAYTDTVLAMMDRFSWTRVVLQKLNLKVTLRNALIKIMLSYWAQN